MKERQKKIRTGVLWTAYLVCILCISLYSINWLSSIKRGNDEMLIEINERLEVLSKSHDQMFEDLNVLRKDNETVGYKQDVLISNYGEWDGESVDITASGLTSEDFTVNEYGMYEYQGRVVVATANIERWDRPLKSDYYANSLGDKLIIEWNGISLSAVVLDVCGACMGNGKESLQRIDIYTIKNVIGLAPGKVHRLNER